ncbi:recombinase family protein [Bosea sp. (in: a-proteobacteria)]|uniref:recombinase family protein n=1 Tax=Bosea sp. (in: a-proteobacteria) TaxID=1871050 RepID=UPI001AC80072|nr:recombinase family protein [Bosea sp. (in: a-proteobacteria)]MBN9437153.1 recombinase family protein [Bosea sp. (in: a-proteobacteria)]
MFIRAYLRASTQIQDAERARADLVRFVEERGQRIAAFYVENESGAKLERPELFRLLADATPGDVCLIEQIDRLTRLRTEDWNRLKAMISDKGLRIVALDLPTSWLMFAAKPDDFTARLFDAVNSMMLDVLAAVSRKDYEDRRRRQAQGIAKAKTEGLYKGRPADAKRNADIAALLAAGHSWTFVQRTTGASRSTLSRIRKEMVEEAAES